MGKPLQVREAIADLLEPEPETENHKGGPMKHLRISSTTGVWFIALMTSVTLTVMAFRDNKPDMIERTATSALSAAFALAMPRNKEETK